MEQDYLKSQSSRDVGKKTIDMSHATSVNFHYDRDAPVKSKRLFSGLGEQLDKSRFDIYTPTRVFMMKAEDAQVSESVEWVAALSEAVTFFS